ncbi:MAG: hypothetical protein EBZ77_07060 [Chitinophagia bacterium]|nr:hypothetical protein [Chitinophagia bacterium]
MQLPNATPPQRNWLGWFAAIYNLLFVTVEVALVIPIQPVKWVIFVAATVQVVSLAALWYLWKRKYIAVNSGFDKLLLLMSTPLNAAVYLLLLLLGLLLTGRFPSCY